MQCEWGFAKVVVTRAGRLQEWSQGKLQLYLFPISGFPCNINVDTSTMAIKWIYLLANKDTVYALNDVWMYRVNPDDVFFFNSTIPYVCNATR